MATIREASPLAQWRRELLPANFDGFPFHVMQGARESGRRIALHEFPKKELPYAEDMGHTAVSFTVQGYMIVYPHEEAASGIQGSVSLYQTDYRFARDALQERLDRGGPGVLQLPTFIKYPMIVVCTRYRLTEEQKNGGYCVFDMQFVERGKQPFTERRDTQADLFEKTFALRSQVRQVWAAEIVKAPKTYLGPIKPKTTGPESEFTKRSTGRASALMGPFNPLVRFIGPPKKHGPIRVKPVPNESEFTTRSRGTASPQMEMWQMGRA